MMSSRKEIVEKALGVKVPVQYTAFLDKYGIYEAPGVEVYGIIDTFSDLERMPCVIGATKIRRRVDNLPHRFLVVHHTGIEDEIVCLDTEDGKVYSLSRWLGDRKVANSFDEWFTRDILEPSREIRERREWQTAYWQQRAQKFLEREQTRRGRGIASSERGKRWGAKKPRKSD